MTLDPLDLQKTREVLGVDVPDKLLVLALTHPSAVGEGSERIEKSNQRLEFLGDAVAGTVAAEYFYRARPDLPEGTLTQWKAASVRGSSLAKAARRLNLGAHLILGKGEEAAGGRQRDTILADAFEAVTGAIFLSHGFETARDFVLRTLKEEIEAASHNAVNVKNLLQEKTQAIGLGTPVYQTHNNGVPGDKRFSSQVLLLGQERGQGTGRTKQEAECRAAQEALDAILSSLSTQNST